MTGHEIAEILVLAGTAYAAAGLIFSVPFLLRGIAKFDPAAAGSGVGFRLLVLPGTVALWPLLLGRWMRGRTAPLERNAHRDRASSGEAS